MNKKVIMFSIIYALLFSGVVVLKYNSTKLPVKIGDDFSLEEGKSVRINNDEMTTVKLISIDSSCENKNSCSGLLYHLSVSGSKYDVAVPSKTKIYGNYYLEAIEGDEDRIVLKVSS